ncbi:hypothetical protein BV20DRAFT_1055640 [Pilatotrama ljubarskyi]|nr:hypothetical protein BV20DRAFT_1055640 [Pilatotrama ljubarskyi]
MLNRLLAGLLHPLIHAGYGLEFGLAGLLAEGLAQAATHPIDGAAIIPPALFSAVDAASLAEAPQCVPGAYSHPLEEHVNSKTNNAGTHALEIPRRVVRSDSFDPAPLDPHKTDPRSAFESAGCVDAAEKLTELFWLNIVLYGVAGCGGRATSLTARMHADFFL